MTPGDANIGAIRDAWLNPPEDKSEQRQALFIANHSEQIDDLMESLKTLSDECEEADIHDPFGVAMRFVVEWIRAVRPEYK